MSCAVSHFDIRKTEKRLGERAKRPRSMRAFLVRGRVKSVVTLRIFCNIEHRIVCLPGGTLVGRAISAAATGAAAFCGSVVRHSVLVGDAASPPRQTSLFRLRGERRGERRSFLSPPWATPTHPILRLLSHFCPAADVAFGEPSVGWLVTAGGLVFLWQSQYF